MLSFVCNICSATSTVESEAALHRDQPSCSSCGSNVRFRWTIHALSTALFGESLCLHDFPRAPHIAGIGLSDEPLYADILAEQLSYRNTFLHREPRFDLTDPECGKSASLDFILATEVFEHIPPPVQPAFDNLSRLLKPDGFVIFSTPWRPQGPTAEHFPNLFHWTLAQLEDEYFLLNKTRDNKLEIFDSLSFHGGAGHTLEMRLFSQPDLNRRFRIAGLEPEWVSESFLKYGIAFPKPWSIPCVVRKKTASAGTVDHASGNLSETTTAPLAVQHDQDRNELAQLYHELDGQTAHIQRLKNQLLALENHLREARTRIAHLEQERDAIRNSKWLRLGNRLKRGPKLS